MKQDWYPDELTQHWTLSTEERELLDSKTSATRLRFALLLKAFQFDGRFPDRREDIAGRIVTYVASQTGVPPAAGRLTAVDLRALSPLKWQHVNPYGTFTLDMHQRLPLEQVAFPSSAALPKFRASLP